LIWCVANLLVHFGLDPLNVLAVAGALGSALIKGGHWLLLIVVVGDQKHSGATLPWPRCGIVLAER